MKKSVKSSHKVRTQDDDYPNEDSEMGIHAIPTSTPRTAWNPSAALKFPCPVGNHKHKVSACSDFFNFSPVERREKIEKGRMCYTCLKAKNVCKGRKCDFVASTPEILKCVICATWAESKGLAPFSIFFCRSKSHTSSRAPLSKLKAELEKYIGKLGTTVVDTKITTEE